MSKRTAACVVAAVTRRSLLIADNLMLNLTREDLEYIYQSIGLFWFCEQIIPQVMIDVEVYPFQLTRNDTGKSLEEELKQAVHRATEIRERYENE